MTRRTLASLTAASQSRRGVDALVGGLATASASETEHLAKLFGAEKPRLSANAVRTMTETKELIAFYEANGWDWRTAAAFTLEQGRKRDKCPNSPAR